MNLMKKALLLWMDYNEAWVSLVTKNNHYYIANTSYVTTQFLKLCSDEKR